MARSARPLLGLLVVGLGTLPAPLDTSVNIAFPAITRAFGLPLADIRWVVIAYVLTYACLMLAFGRLGDLVGHRRIFRLGLLVGALGFAACAAAPTYALLLAGRVMQGVGVSLILSCGPALATSLFPEHERARALAFYAAVTAVGAALGPLAGGIAVEAWGWPAIFWLRVPLVLLALALSWRLPAPPATGSMRGFDAPGALLLVVCMSAALLATAGLPEPLDRLLAPALGPVALAGLALFVLRQMRHPQPLIRLSIFRQPGFALINGLSVAVNLAAFAVLLLVPYFLVRMAGLDAAAGGALLAVGAVGTVIGSWVAGRLAGRGRVGLLAAAGAALAAAGLGAVSAWTPHTPLALLGLSLLAQGLGVGLFQVAYADLVVAALPAAERGVAGSLTILTRTLGVVLGASGLSAAHALAEAAAAAAGAPPAEAFLTGFQCTFRIAALGLGLSLALGLANRAVWRMRA